MDSRSLDIFFSARGQVVPSFCLYFPLCVLSRISGDSSSLATHRTAFRALSTARNLSTAVPVLQSSVVPPRHLSGELIHSHGDADGSEPSLPTAWLPLLFLGSPFQKRAGNTCLAAKVESMGHCPLVLLHSPMK